MGTHHAKETISFKDGDMNRSPELRNRQGSGTPDFELHMGGIMGIPQAENRAIREAHAIQETKYGQSKKKGKDRERKQEGSPGEHFRLTNSVIFSIFYDIQGFRGKEMEAPKSSFHLERGLEIKT